MSKESWQISDELLYVLYVRAKNNEKPWLKHSNLSVSPTSKLNGFEGLLLQGLVAKKYVDVRQDESEFAWGGGLAALNRLMTRQKQEYQISLRGLDYVIRELEDDDSHISKVASGVLEPSVMSFPQVSRARVQPSIVQPTAKHSEEIAESAPASDRLVPLNHNEPEYLRVKEEFQNAKQAIVAINIDAAKERARDSVVAALDAAARLWDAAELTVMQIKFGILLAAENAAEFCKETAQAVKVSLLVEAIKAFIVSKIGSGFS